VAASVASSSSFSSFYVSTEMTPKSVPLWIEHASNFYDGNQLHTLCGANGAQSSFCSGYITGVADILQNQNANNICLPNNATVGQITDVVKKYLVDHPETRQYTAYSEVFLALQTGFPCHAK
jgi:hypothetical protein